MPSNFVILDKKIEGYNNILTTATEEMSFGVNKDVNYAKPARPTKPTKPKQNKPDGLIDDYFDNINGSSNNSADNSDDIHSNIRGRLRSLPTHVRGDPKTSITRSPPIVFTQVFLLALSAGAFTQIVFRKLF